MKMAALSTGSVCAVQFASKSVATVRKHVSLRCFLEVGLQVWVGKYTPEVEQWTQNQLQLVCRIRAKLNDVLTLILFIFSSFIPFIYLFLSSFSHSSINTNSAFGSEPSEI